MPPGPKRRRASASIDSTWSMRVERLGHHHVRPSRELAFEPVPLGRRVGGGRIERTGDGEPGTLADRAAGRVLGAIEPRQHLDQPDRIDVPDPCPGRVIADPRRVAGQGDDVADPERVRAEQLRFERHQVPVARRAVDETLEVEVVLDRRMRPTARSSELAPSPSRETLTRSTPTIAQEARGLDGPLDPDAPRRIDLDRDDEPAGVERLGRDAVGGGASSASWARPASVPRAAVEGRARPVSVAATGASAGCVERGPHRGDVPGCRPAAAADDPCPGSQEARRDRAEVLGGSAA